MSYFETLKSFKTINLDQMRPSGFLERINTILQGKNSDIYSKSGWKLVQQCPVCKSQDKKVKFSKYGIDIVQCQECSLCYSQKIPCNTEDIYSAEGYVDMAKEAYLKNMEYRIQRFGKERIDILNQYFPAISDNRILDIGCGTGWFMECAKRAGYSVEGQELGKPLAHWTSENLGFNVHTCTIEQMDPQKPFQIISMFDMLEHVEDPVGLIRDCKKLLSPDGILLVFTPNFDSLAFSVMKEQSNLVTPAEHLTYFTKKSVLRALDESGFSLEYYSTNGIDLGDLKSFYEYLGELELSKACSHFYELLQPVIDAAGAGNHLRFIARVQ